jgi:PPOX class probable FMN-dependent enzyme
MAAYPASARATRITAEYCHMSEHMLNDLAALDLLYGKPAEASVVKEIDFVHPHYRAFIEAAPFLVLATGGPGGLDASPRGDPAGFVVVEDEKTLLIPDRRGNKRIDSLRNLIADDRVGLLFLIPGITETLRVNGRAAISVDPALLDRFAIDGRRPLTVLVVRVEAVYFQCSRAIIRSDLWNAEKQIARGALPSTGTILADLSHGRVGGVAYDRELPERVRTTLY